MIISMCAADTSPVQAEKNVTCAGGKKFTCTGGKKCHLYRRKKMPPRGGKKGHLGARAEKIAGEISMLAADCRGGNKNKNNSLGRENKITMSPVGAIENLWHPGARARVREGG